MKSTVSQTKLFIIRFSSIALPFVTQIENVECKINFDGFYPDDAFKPSIFLQGSELKSEVLFGGDDLLSLVARDVKIFRILNDAKFKCVFPVTSRTEGLCLICIFSIKRIAICRLQMVGYMRARLERGSPSYRMGSTGPRVAK